MYTILASRNEIVARRIVDRRIKLEELIQAESGVTVDNSPAEVSSQDSVKIVAFSIVVFRTNGRSWLVCNTVRAPREHVVAAGAIDGWIQLVEFVDGDAISCGDRVTSTGCDKIGFRASANESWTSPISLYDRGRLLKYQYAPNNEAESSLPPPRRELCRGASLDRRLQIPKSFAAVIKNDKAVRGLSWAV